MTQKQRHKKSLKQKNNKKTLENFAKYSGLSFQMIAIILASVYGGIKIDEYLQWDFPLFTLLLSLLGVFAAMYFAIKDFIGNDKNNKK